MSNSDDGWEREAVPRELVEPPDPPDIPTIDLEEGMSTSNAGVSQWPEEVTDLEAGAEGDYEPVEGLTAGSEPVAVPKTPFSEPLPSLKTPPIEPTPARLKGTQVMSESVEEMLNQTSEQTVRLHSIDDRIDQLAKGIRDLAEQVQALAEKPGPPRFPTSRFKELERHAAVTERYQSRTIVLSVLQLVVILVLAGMLWILRPAAQHSSEEMRPNAVSTMPKPETERVQAPEESAPVENKRTVRRRRRRR